jgi:hypothetical protein
MLMSAKEWRRLFPKIDDEDLLVGFNVDRKTVLALLADLKEAQDGLEECKRLH